MRCNMYYVGQHTSTTQWGTYGTWVYREHGDMGIWGVPRWREGVSVYYKYSSKRCHFAREVAASLLNELKISYSY